MGVWVLERHAYIDVDDPEQASDLGSQLFFPMRLRPQADDGFRAVVNHAALARLDINFVRFGGRCGIEPAFPENSYVLTIPCRKLARIESPDASVTLRPRAVGHLVSPRHAYSASYDRGAETVSVVIRADALRRHEEMLGGQEVTGAPHFAETVDLSRPPGATMAEVLWLMIADLEREDGLWRHSPIALGYLQDAILTTLLTTQPRLRQPDGPARTAQPSVVLRVEEHMRRHAWSPLSLEDLAAVAGVSGRSLQRTFLAVHGCGPMARLRDIRLGLARDRLLAAQPHETVTAVALDCGHFHLGRFSTEYRARFGELPSETLRRARGAPLVRK
ncbi:MAG: AraC family transcriptional regulator [Actinomycetota bacterium]